MPLEVRCYDQVFFFLFFLIVQCIMLNLDSETNTPSPPDFSEGGFRVKLVTYDWPSPPGPVLSPRLSWQTGSCCTVVPSLQLYSQGLLLPIIMRRDYSFLKLHVAGYQIGRHLVLAIVAEMHTLPLNPAEACGSPCPLFKFPLTMPSHS